MSHTPKERVLEKYPDAFVEQAVDANLWMIRRESHSSILSVGRGKTIEAAWASAAEKIEPAPEPPVHDIGGAGLEIVGPHETQEEWRAKFEAKLKETKQAALAGNAPVTSYSPPHDVTLSTIFVPYAQPAENAPSESAWPAPQQSESPACKHRQQSGHPANSDIRLCLDCDMRSVDGGITWMTFADYQANHCGKSPAADELPSKTGDEILVEAAMEGAQRSHYWFLQAQTALTRLGDQFQANVQLSQFNAELLAEIDRLKQRVEFLEKQREAEARIKELEGR
jgi:hypothetical protein